MGVHTVSGGVNSNLTLISPGSLKGQLIHHVSAPPNTSDKMHKSANTSGRIPRWSSETVLSPAEGDKTQH